MAASTATSGAVIRRISGHSRYHSTRATSGHAHAPRARRRRREEHPRHPGAVPGGAGLRRPAGLHRARRRSRRSATARATSPSSTCASAPRAGSTSCRGCSPSARASTWWSSPPTPPSTPPSRRCAAARATTCPSPSRPRRSGTSSSGCASGGTLLRRVEDLEGRLAEAAPDVDLETASPRMRAALDVLERAAASDAAGPAARRERHRQGRARAPGARAAARGAPGPSRW